MLSWAVRMTAGLMLAYMLGLVILETTASLNLVALPDPDLERWCGSIFLTVFTANLFLWPLWCGFANQALKPKVRPDFKSQPVMAAVWFIVPGAFLLTPWAVVREIYLASQDPTDWRDQKAPVVGWWWIARVVTYFAAWPLCTPVDPQSDGFVKLLVIQLVIGAELTLEILLMSQMAGWQKKLASSAADVF